MQTTTTAGTAKTDGGNVKFYAARVEHGMPAYRMFVDYCATFGANRTEAIRNMKRSFGRRRGYKVIVTIESEIARAQLSDYSGNWAIGLRDTL